MLSYNLASDGVIDLTTPSPPRQAHVASTTSRGDLDKSLPAPVFEIDDSDEDKKSNIAEKRASSSSFASVVAPPIHSTILSAQAASGAWGNLTDLKENIPSSKDMPAKSFSRKPSPKTSRPAVEASSSKPSSRQSSSKRGLSSKPSSTDSSRLPTYSYREYVPPPPVIYARTEEEVDEVLEDLTGPLGFDLEWKVDHHREHPAALVQLSDGSIITLIQVSAMKRFPPKLKELIENPAVPKLGVNIRNDAMKLYRDYGILSRNIIELGALACAADTRFASIFGRSIVALAKVVAFYLHRRLDKGPVRTSDWERELTREQMIYAANDAHCAVMVYRRVMTVARAAKKTLDPAVFTSDLGRELEKPGSSEGPSNALGCTTPHNGTSSAGKAKPRHLQAYTLWHAGRGLLDICIHMRSASNPLQDATVITYIVTALSEDASLPFSMAKLEALVKGEATSWRRHKEVILGMGQAGRGAD